MKSIRDVTDNDIRCFLDQISLIIKTYDFSKNKIFGKITIFFSYSVADRELIESFQLINLSYSNHATIKNVLLHFINHAKKHKNLKLEDHRMLEKVATLLKNIFDITNEEVHTFSPLRLSLPRGGGGPIATSQPVQYFDSFSGLLALFGEILPQEEKVSNEIVFG